MKDIIIKELSKHLPLSKKQIENLIETPPSSDLGDYSFPCFTLAKKQKSDPIKICQSLALKIKSKDFEKIEAKGPYINFFLDRNQITKSILEKIQKQKDTFGSSNIGKKKTAVIDMSSPNIAKPFGIGHLRSTIIGNSLAKTGEFQGYKIIKINYLGDWGTPFGKLIAGFKKFGSQAKLKKSPIKHLYEIYVKVNKSEDFDDIGKEWFNKLEANDKEAMKYWKKFRELSLKDFEKIYSLLNIKFDVISGESFYNDKMQATISDLKKKKLLTESEGAQIVDLSKHNLGVALIQKSDGATLYTTRDLTAAIYRKKKYKADCLVYEVGSEQKYHFKQVFKILKLLGHKWAEEAHHVDHGLYLDSDGKKFATRKGKTIFMEDILEETKSLAAKEISKRASLSKAELEKRALAVTRAAIFYGDLKNYRSNDMVFDIKKFIDFEGNTGPYLLYAYARARSILRKAKYKKSKVKINQVSDKEKALILELSKFPQVVLQTCKQFAPNLIANYSYDIAQKFNEFYHAEKVIGSEEESFRLALVDSFSQVLKNSLNLLGIETLEKM
ncbi:arginine--tRNA ligase [Candidatus Pacearchaeota archaeon]|nr:arginine--tRNA ligase [Candidatus Pacearchaeota archaeon]